MLDKIDSIIVSFLYFIVVFFIALVICLTWTHYKKGKTENCMFYIATLFALLPIIYMFSGVSNYMQRDKEKHIKESFSITCQDEYIHTTILDGDYKIFLDDDGKPIACTDSVKK